MAKRTSKKIIHEADASGNLKFSSPLDMQGHDADKTPESAVQAKETAVEYIFREYGDVIRSGNVARILEDILVEIVKWRMDR